MECHSLTIMYSCAHLRARSRPCQRRCNRTPAPWPLPGTVLESGRFLPTLGTSHSPPGIVQWDWFLVGQPCLGYFPDSGQQKRRKNEQNGNIVNAGVEKAESPGRSWPNRRNHIAGLVVPETYPLVIRAPEFRPVGPVRRRPWGGPAAGLGLVWKLAMCPAARDFGPLASNFFAGILADFKEM